MKKNLFADSVCKIIFASMVAALLLSITLFGTSARAARVHDTEQENSSSGRITNGIVSTSTETTIYLPIILNRWPPMPILSPVDQNNGVGNSEPDGNYTIRWSSTPSDPQPIYYVLEEAENMNFSDAHIIYQGPQTSFVITNRDRPPVGSPYNYYLSAYQYRVKSCGEWGCGSWSNTEATSVSCINSGRGGRETVGLSPRMATMIHFDLLEKTLPGYGYSLWEVEIYGPNTGDNNLARNKTVHVSSIESPLYHPEYLVDGNLYTRWSSAFFDDNEWVEIVLPQPEVVSKIVLYWENAYAEEYRMTTNH